MSLPPFPDPCFPNAATVRLCGDVGNVEGGFNPVPGSPHSFGVSVQDRGTRWTDRNTSITDYMVYFQSDPALTLGRAIRSGDQIVWNGLTLNAMGPATNRGGFDWLWRVKCEHVVT